MTIYHKLQFAISRIQFHGSLLVGIFLFGANGLAQSSQTHMACEDVYNQYFASHQVLLQNQPLRRDEFLQLVQRSNSSPDAIEETVLILQSKNGQRKLFSSAQLPEAPDSQLIKFSVNRARTLVALGYIYKGSIDHYSIVIIDVSNGTIKGKIERLAWGGVLDWNLAWRTDSILTWSQASREFDVGVGAPQESNYRLKGVKDDIAVFSKKSDSTSSLYFVLPDGRQVTFSKAAFGYGQDVTVFGVSQDFVYFRDLSGDFQRFRLPKTDDDLISTQLEQIPLRLPLRDPTLSPSDPTAYRAVLDITLKQNIFFVKSAWGLHQFLTVYNTNGQKIFETPIPLHSNLLSADWIGETKYKLNLESAARIHETIYDVMEGGLDHPGLREIMTTSESGLRIQTRVIDVQSQDGTKIPVRLTYLAETQMNGANPVLLQIYGGFGIRGPVDPKFNPQEYAFLQKGGVLVNAGLRGGSEFGPLWYASGIGRKQQNKLDDLIATAKWIESSGLSQAHKIIALSGSNGGYVITSAALQAPDAFGLVIPVNGIFDLTNVANAKALRSEYGDPTNAKDLEYLRQISPLTLAQNFRGLRPEFFIFRGSADSRVNPQESADLAEALSLSEGPVQLMTIPDGGHLMQRPQIQRQQSQRFHRALWRKIFDFCGFTP